MSESFYRHYEQELLFIRQMSQEFAQQYPAAAGRLLLEPNRSVDPHVERLIESFAFLTARVQQKLDDDFPELTDALLNILYPHYLAPIPSSTIVQFELDASNAQPGGVTVERHSQLHTQKIGDVACLFRTCYPVTLWPISVVSAGLLGPPFPPAWQPPRGTVAALRLQLECLGDKPFSALSMDALRFYLDGDQQLIARLYELIFNRTSQVVFRSLDEDSGVPPVVLEPQSCLRQVGFERDEGLYPYPNQSFLGYRLLTEFFAFPEKFLFFDLSGWQRAAQAGFGKQVEVVLYFDRTFASLQREINAQNFRLGCTPAVNLFEQTAEPIQLTEQKYEYRVVPDVHQPLGMEVYSVDRVTGVDTRANREYKPFYSVGHGQTANGTDVDEAYWYALRKSSPVANDSGTDVYLHLLDLAFDPRLPAESVLIAHTTCTNRDLPATLEQLGGDSLRLELEAAVPLSGVRCLRSPSAPLRPPRRRNAHWRLLSHLSLNHLSINDPVEGRATLQEILRLYDFSESRRGQQLAAVNRQFVEGITAVSSRRVVGRTGGPTASGFCRGVEVTIELDEQKYVGTGAFLFASVLERFLGLYASVNSFSQLVVKTEQSDGLLKKWAPRAGELQLV